MHGKKRKKVSKKKIEEREEIDIQQFGQYRLGLTFAEVNAYLRQRTRKQDVTKLREQFNKAAGVNTMAIGPGGHLLMYRSDVKRFADLVLDGTPTHFD